MPDFVRARSEEQREVRRQAILETAVGMLGELRVAELTLNELSRRVGLAKSNVLHYFESREAILLTVLEQHRAAWLDELADRLRQTTTRRSSTSHLCRSVAATIASSLGERPLLCDLLNAQASVLERNVSGEVAARYKRAASADVQRLGELLAERVKALELSAATDVSVGITVTSGALWAYAQPSEGMNLAYESDPALRELRLAFVATLQRQVELLLLGALSS